MFHGIINITKMLDKIEVLEHLMKLLRELNFLIKRMNFSTNFYRGMLSNFEAKNNMFRFNIIILTLFLSIFTMNAQLQVDTSRTYIHQENASFKSKFIQGISALLGVKKNKKLIKKINQDYSNEIASAIPESIKRTANIQEVEIDNNKVWTFEPKTGKSDKIILYVHGGAYFGGIKKYHWTFTEELVKSTGATVVVPDYPLPPIGDPQQVYDMVHKIYLNLIKESSPATITLVGDSSGGGIVLGFGMYLRDKEIEQPSQLILLSPWLDVTMSNPHMREIDKDDKMLGIESLKMAGKAYADSYDLENYMVSPIYGNLNGVAKVSVFIGTHDLFLADCRKLKAQANQSKIALNYFEYPKMFHGWMLLKGMKESIHAQEQICSLIVSS